MPFSSHLTCKRSRTFVAKDELTSSGYCTNPNNHTPEGLKATHPAPPLPIHMLPLPANR